MGSALLERTLLCARNRGVKHVQVSCLPQNQRMQRLARKFEATFSFDYDTVIGTMENPNPTPVSFTQEMLADGNGFAAAYVDFQSRVSAAGRGSFHAAFASRRAASHIAVYSPVA